MNVMARLVRATHERGRLWWPAAAALRFIGATAIPGRPDKPGDDGQGEVIP
ncbi:MAG: hypothetical protein ACHP9T_02455 [Caulobacterales bacterium]|jgi:hypothetical protein